MIGFDDTYVMYLENDLLRWSNGEIVLYGLPGILEEVSNNPQLDYKAERVPNLTKEIQREIFHQIINDEAINKRSIKYN